MPGRWTAAVAEARTRQLALLMALGATVCWVWFGFALRRTAQDGLDVTFVGLATAGALAVLATSFAAAFTGVACLASLLVRSGEGAGVPTPSRDGEEGTGAR